MENQTVVVLKGFRVGTERTLVTSLYSYDNYSVLVGGVAVAITLFLGPGFGGLLVPYMANMIRALAT